MTEELAPAKNQIAPLSPINDPEVNTKFIIV